MINRNSYGWIRPPKKVRTGKFLFEVDAPITLESQRGGDDWAMSSDPRMADSQTFPVGAAALSSSQAWMLVSGDDAFEDRYGLCAGDMPHHQARIDNKGQFVDIMEVPCDIYGKIMDGGWDPVYSQKSFIETFISTEALREKEDQHKRFCKNCSKARRWVKEIEKLIDRRFAKLSHYQWPPKAQ